MNSEIEDMKRNWRLWVEKIKIATMDVLPDSSIKLIRNKCNDNSIDKIIIESPNLPSEKFILKNIIWEILRKSGLPIYNPFYIILRSGEDSNLEITISKPK